MNKVSWPSRSELFRYSVVVIIMIFAIGMLLAAFDIIWIKLFTWIMITTCDVRFRLGVWHLGLPVVFELDRFFGRGWTVVTEQTGPNPEVLPDLPAMPRRSIRHWTCAAESRQPAEMPQPVECRSRPKCRRGGWKRSPSWTRLHRRPLSTQYSVLSIQYPVPKPRPVPRPRLCPASRKLRLRRLPVPSPRLRQRRGRGCNRVRGRAASQGRAGPPSQGEESSGGGARRRVRRAEIGEHELVHPQGPEQPRGVDPRRPVAAGFDSGPRSIFRRGHCSHREGHGIQGRQEAGDQAEALSRLYCRPHGNQRRHVVPGA